MVHHYILLRRAFYFVGRNNWKSLSDKRLNFVKIRKSKYIALLMQSCLPFLIYKQVTYKFQSQTYLLEENIWNENRNIKEISIAIFRGKIVITIPWLCWLRPQYEVVFPFRIEFALHSSYSFQSDRWKPILCEWWGQSFVLPECPYVL